MPNDPAVELAKELHLLGVSNAGVVELLTQYPHDRIRKQLDYLPHRKAKRPEAIIIEAVRNNYSAPKTYFEHYYAKNTSSHPQPRPLVDEGAKHPVRQAHAGSEGYGAEGAPPDDSSDEWIRPGGQSCDLAVPPANQTNGQSE